MKHDQFSFGYSLRIMWQPPGKLTVEDPLSFSVPERLYHKGIITLKNHIVKGYYWKIRCSEHSRHYSALAERHLALRPLAQDRPRRIRCCHHAAFRLIRALLYNWRMTKPTVDTVSSPTLISLANHFPDFSQ